MFNRKQIVAMEKCNTNRFICNSNRLLCLQDIIGMEWKHSNRLHCNVIDPRPGCQRMINEQSKLYTNCINASSVITSKIKLTDISQGQVRHYE